ncbi:MAG: DUF4240 domain-containing protein [Chloroflexota bacterium]
MNLEQFWNWIEEINHHQFPDDEHKIDFMMISLTKLPPSDIVDFNRILDQLIAKTFMADFWNIAIAVYCECSFNAFQAVCAWLIFQGKKNYENAIKDPRSILRIIPKDTDIRNEDYQFFALAAYEMVMDDEEMPLEDKTIKEIDGGIAMSYEEARAMFPEFAEYFRECTRDMYI